MDGPATMSEVLSLLGSGITPHDLAENMCNPLWYLARLPIETDMAIAITSLRALRDRVRKENQRALIDEFINPPDPSDTERVEFIVEQMRLYFSPEENAAILAKCLSTAIADLEAEEADEVVAPSLTPGDHNHRNGSRGGKPRL